MIESGARRNVFGVKTLQNNDMYMIECFREGNIYCGRALHDE